MRNFYTHYLRPSSAALGVSILLSGCANWPVQERQPKKVEVSYLEQPLSDSTVNNASGAEAGEKNGVTLKEGTFTKVPSLAKENQGFTNDIAIADLFSTKPSLTIAADNMALIDFLHYSFGDLLKASYILGEGLDSDSSKVSLNIQDDISPQKLYTLTEQLLLARSIGIKRQNELLYIYKITKDSTDLTAVGYGRTADTVPNAINVQQIVPLRYLMNSNAMKTIRDITNVKTTADVSQGVLFLSGERQQVVRALELLDLLDAPGSRSRNIGFLTLTYIDAESFITSVTEILKNEGIMTGDQSQDNRVSFVPINQLGAVAVFASEADFVTRVQYWATQLDKPSKGKDLQYFVYSPQFARASDLGQSVSALISGRSAGLQQAEKASEDKAATIENRSANTSGVSNASNDKMNMVVDERSNSLIFYTSGAEYQAMLPLVARLDVMPKQVMLEVAIAEVTMTDEFKFGVDVAFSSGNFSFSNAFGGAGIGGSVLKWASGGSTIDAQAFESNKWVNVLSKPTLLVRDGVAASIQVGTDIPVVGKTTTDPTTGTSRSIEYRKTGISVKVTPTINAQGVVIMTIDQTNSNTVDAGSDVEGNPQIFERSLSTEVVAESGQTVIMGGLISENNNDNSSGLPGLRSLPFIGPLFGNTTNTKIKTELVIMVTPKVISRSDEWDDIKTKLRQGLEYIELPQ
ncbi:secretin N-terminal domain-containing protein [Shewanella sp. SM74]|uniref:secretin N-terminal domain-containing protein n=1 Tax=Shewanella sp. SM74 TaxID=2912807 RepID=UPI0021DB1F04|nr:secretin N-terminal domain-containing protein [Shewanella sp. SM74]MCU8011279.1 general secretion pathway protein GspD [Shewanella sp. SM74]